MPSYLFPEEPPKRAHLLSQAVDLLIWELSAISNRHWEQLPELKKKKAVLASRLLQLGATPPPTGAEEADLLELKSQIADLESQSRQKVDGYLEIIGYQVTALQDLHQYWRECLSISFGKFFESTPAP
jgi:uncharacterized protein involved in exopolysaccharide biosynthesis